MTEPIWVPLMAVYVIHDRQIARHGGASGIRDIGLLETGHARPKNKYFYEQADVMTCAAAYGFGLAKAHAFIDGNKRTAFVVTATFLQLNGYSLRPNPAEGVKMMEDLASDKTSEEVFRAWLHRVAISTTR
ncbi:MAG: type II toxin-antitoxin system death-on-curing family toxin [Litoreibacter sp.]